MSNKIIVFWTIIMFLLLSSIFLVGDYYLKNKEYILLKKEFKNNVDIYLKKQDLYPENKETITVNSSELIENELIERLEYNNNECDGVAKVSKKMIFYIYDIDLNCK